MSKIIPVALFFLSFFASLVSNAILRKFANDNKVLLDKPDDRKKFHPNPTPLTGGLGITIGVIFSSIFLVLLSQSSENINTNINLNLVPAAIEENSIFHEIELENGSMVIIKKYNNESYTIQLPTGELLLYETSSEVQRDQGQNFQIIKQNSVESEIGLNQFSLQLLLFTLLVQIIMIIDDLRTISPLKKIVLQSACVLGLALSTDVYLVSIGNIFGFGEIQLGIFAIPFTIFCIVGMMNAFNMIDGLNGLCASFCLICFVSMIYMINTNNLPSLFPLILPVGALSGFLMYNLGFLGERRTVFLGDNGSNALGFMCAWILVYFSNFDGSNLLPVTALWLVAIPLMDALRVIITRIIKLKRIYLDDREHIHHQMIDNGYSYEQTYSFLIISSGFFALIGLAFNKYFFEYGFYSFYTFLGIFTCYYWFSSILLKSKNV